MPPALLALPDTVLERVLGFTLHPDSLRTAAALAATCRAMRRIGVSWSAWSPQLGLLAADPPRDRVPEPLALHLVTADYVRRRAARHDLLDAAGWAAAPVVCLCRGSTAAQLRHLVARSLGFRDGLDGFRLWSVCPRRNGTIRISEPVQPAADAEAWWVCYPPWYGYATLPHHLYVEEVAPPRVDIDPDDAILLFLKYDDARAVRFVGTHLAAQDTPLRDVCAALRRMLGLEATHALCVYEDVCIGSPAGEVHDRFGLPDEDALLYMYELKSGDVLVAHSE